MWTLRPVAFAALPGWESDDLGAALSAFARHAGRPADVTYRRGALGIADEDLAPLFGKAGSPKAQADPRRFFEENFDAYRIADEDRGLVTAFYEPVVEASRARSDAHAMPFYRRPADLVSVNDDNRPLGWDPEIRFGRLGPDGSISPYPDRSEINAGFLAGRGLEIAWADPVDVFFTHIQGAARLEFEDGSACRITYDGKSGHPFTGIGRLLVDQGEIDAGSVGMQAIRDWLKADAARARKIMERNRSYIFFREVEADDAEEGPVAAAKIPLTAERSLAVDRLIHTFGTPVFVSADDVNGESWSKLMIAQDTGSAIVGPARGDLFMGTGDEAGRRAGNVKSAADFCILVRKAARIGANLQVEA